jgi:hypothetical protein
MELNNQPACAAYSKPEEIKVEVDCTDQPSTFSALLRYRTRSLKVSIRMAIRSHRIRTATPENGTHREN